MQTTYRLSGAYAVWLATLCTLAEWSGLLRVRLTPVTAWLFTLVAAGAALAFERWAARTPAPALRPISIPQRSRFAHAAWILAAVAFLAYALLWVPAYARPDFTWDGMWYHLPTIHLWAEKGYVHWIEPPADAGEAWTTFTDSLLNGYPKSAEVVGFTLARLSGGRLVNASNLVFIPLAILSIAALAMELGASRAPAFAAALLFALVPTNVGQAASTYVDTAFASAVVGFLSLFFLQLRYLLASAQLRIPLPLAVASGAALGLALGVKAPALGLAALSLVALAVPIGVRLRRRRQPIRRQLRSLSMALVTMGAIAVVVGGFWYLRNAVVAGNPMHPFEVKAAGHVVFPGTPVAEMIAEEANTPPFMRDWSRAKKILYAWRQSGRLELPIDGVVEHNEDGYAIDFPEAHEPAWPRSIRYVDPRSGGLGFIWLYGGVPSLVVLAALFVTRRQRTSRADALRRARNIVAGTLFLATCAVFFLITPMAWWARYTLWLHVAGLAALAVVLDRLLVGLAKMRPFAFVATPYLVGLSLLSLFEYGYALKWTHSPAYFVGPARIHRGSSIAEIWDALTTSKDDGLSAIFFDLPRSDLARDALAGDAVVALGPLSVGHGPVLGQLSMPVGRRRWIMTGPDAGEDAAAAERYVRAHQPRYVIWDPETNGPAPGFEAIARRAEGFAGLRIFELGAEQSRPPVVLPK